MRPQAWPQDFHFDAIGAAVLPAATSEAATAAANQRRGTMASGRWSGSVKVRSTQRFEPSLESLESLEVQN